MGANSGELQCTKLTVVKSDRIPQVRLDADEAGGFLWLGSPEMSLALLLCAAEDDGEVSTYLPEGKMVASVDGIVVKGVISIGEG